MAIDVRKAAEEYLKVVPALPRTITSNGETAALFTRLTGATQAALEKNWAAGGYWTTCNEFVGHYARAALKSKDYLGRFDLDTYLKKVGKGHAWVPRAKDVWPKYGDVFLIRDAKHLHVGISLDFDGDVWNTVESGQGGPKMKCDVIKRLERDYDASAHIGWVDLAVYLDPANQSHPVPGWLLGWWEVTWRSQTFFYYFDNKFHVKWTEHRPLDTLRPPLMAGGTGAFGVEGTSGVTIRWGATGTVERFGRLPTTTDDVQMAGTWNDLERISAVQM